MSSFGSPSAKTPPTGLHSAADLVSATRKAILVAVLSLVVAIAAIAAAGAPMLRGTAEDPAAPTGRDLAKRLDQIAAELDRLRQMLQQRDSAQTELLNRQRQLTDGLATLTQEAGDLRNRLTRDVAALRTEIDGMRAQSENADKPAAEDPPSRRRGRRGRKSMTFTVPRR